MSVPLPMREGGLHGCRPSKTPPQVGAHGCAPVTERDVLPESSPGEMPLQAGARGCAPAKKRGALG